MILKNTYHGRRGAVGLTVLVVAGLVLAAVAALSLPATPPTVLLPAWPPQATGLMSMPDPVAFDLLPQGAKTHWHKALTNDEQAWRDAPQAEQRCLVIALVDRRIAAQGLLGWSGETTDGEPGLIDLASLYDAAGCPKSAQGLRALKNKAESEAMQHAVEQLREWRKDPSASYPTDPGAAALATWRTIRIKESADAKLGALLKRELSNASNP